MAMAIPRTGYDDAVLKRKRAEVPPGGSIGAQLGQRIVAATERVRSISARLASLADELCGSMPGPGAESPPNGDNVIGQVSDLQDALRALEDTVDRLDRRADANRAEPDYDAAVMAQVYSR